MQVTLSSRFVILGQHAGDPCCKLGLAPPGVGDQRCCLFDIRVGQEEGVRDADVVVDVVEIGRVLARHGFLGEGTGQAQLVEHGLVSTEEAELLYFGVAVGVRDHVAHVEDEAVVVHVGEVAVLFGALERRLDAAHHQLGPVRQVVRFPLGPGSVTGNNCDNDG